MKAHNILLYTGTLLGTALALPKSPSKNSTYFNPIIPGFHPDPSCIFVPEWDDTFFCASSSFIAYPGIPIHASKDLVNWKLVSYVYNRVEQLPDFQYISNSQDGWFAATLRYHDGKFWAIDACVGAQNAIFTSDNPYDNAAWSIGVPVNTGGYDPDLFWDDDGQLYVSEAITISTGDEPFNTNIQQIKVDPTTGAASSHVVLWDGPPIGIAEGPHIYKRADGYYYLLTAAGGTATGHQVDITRSKKVTGPYIPYSGNPILTATNTSEYFQTIGHADLFQDASGNWWGVALTTRSGPEYVDWPMGRETVLYPAKWTEGDWPVLGGPVTGEMSGPLPPKNKNVPGKGAFVKDPDHYNFPPGSTIPTHFNYWSVSHPENYVISPEGHHNSLELKPSYANLTTYATYNATYGQTLIMRRQTDTLFTYSIDVSFDPCEVGEEAGATLFLTQDAHAEFAIVYLQQGSSTQPQAYLRFQERGVNATAPIVKAIPKSWKGKKVNFQIKATSPTEFAFFAGPAGEPKKLEQITTVPAALVSSGFTGSFVGVYNTNNGNSKGQTSAYFSDWIYQGMGQYIGNGQYYPSNGQK